MNKVKCMDDWSILHGLGYVPWQDFELNNVSMERIRNADVLHFNGQRFPWDPSTAIAVYLFCFLFPFCFLRNADSVIDSRGTVPNSLRRFSHFDILLRTRSAHKRSDRIRR